MKDVLDFVKKNLGLEDEDDLKTNEETIIIPEHTFYEIILMKAKNIDDILDALEQVSDEKTPVIMDIGYLEAGNPEDFRIAGEKLKTFRKNVGGQAILLCKDGKNVIIVTPPEVKLVKK